MVYPRACMHLESTSGENLDPKLSALMIPRRWVLSRTTPTEAHFVGTDNLDRGRASSIGSIPARTSVRALFRASSSNIFNHPKLRAAPVVLEVRYSTRTAVHLLQPRLPAQTAP